uniref:Uncharacterized protein n=1 Tax=Arundo donax TaxID=35708 RepID=A0A0A9CIK7_ARUDO
MTRKECCAELIPSVVLPVWEMSREMWHMLC